MEVGRIEREFLFSFLCSVFGECIIVSLFYFILFRLQ